MDNEPFEDVFPIKHGDIPASYVSLPPEGLRRALMFRSGGRIFSENPPAANLAV